jgi:hypothetical protein
MLKHFLGLQDYFEAGYGLRFSWDNCRDDERILARLDRFYTSDKGIRRNMLQEYRVRGDAGISDHLLVSFRLSLKEEQDQKSCYKMNSTWLSTPEVKSEITRIWPSHPEGTHFLVKNIGKSSDFTKPTIGYRLRNEDTMR